MKLNKDFEFSLKVMVLIILIAFLAFDFALQIYAPKKNLEGIPALERLEIYYAYFTTQSNYAVVIYLIVAIFMRRIYNTKPVFGIELAMTVYISVTMIVFWFGLLASPDELSAYYPSNWVSTAVLHLCIPSIMVGYFLLSCGDHYHAPRRYSKFSLPLTCGYPAGYLIFAMVRGEIRFKYFSPDFFKEIYGFMENGMENDEWKPGIKWFWKYIWSYDKGVIDKTKYYTQQMWYPYWFLNIHQFKLEREVTPNNYVIESQSIGPEWMLVTIFIIACLSITFLVVGLQYFYLNWNNGKFYRWHDIEGKLITKEEHDYRIQKAKLKKITFKNEQKMEALHKKVEFKIFLKSIKSLERSERISKRKKYIKARVLEEKLKKAAIKQDKVIYKSNKEKIKRFILSLNYKDRAFVRDNIREAERYKKLVKNGVLIFNPKYTN